MSNPTETTQADPHPVSGHRTPREIAEDEAGPIGHPDADVATRAALDLKPPPAAPASHPRAERP
jgi:hypothetical protein